MADEYQQFPRGTVGFGSGNLSTCTDAVVKIANNAKDVHVLQQLEAIGFVMGRVAVSGTFNLVIGEDGLERDVIEMVRKGKRKNFRFKDPSGATEIKGVLTECSKEYKLEDAISVPCSFIGKMG
jgi:hypothetical protein